MRAADTRIVVATLGVLLSAAPLLWVGGPVGVGLTAVGVLGLGVAVLGRNAGALTVVAAAAIGHVAAARHPLPAAGVIAIAVLLAAFLAASELAETNRWEKPPRKALPATGTALLAGVAGTAVLAVVGGLPRPTGWIAAVVAVVGAVAAAAVLQISAAPLPPSSDAD